MNITIIDWYRYSSFKNWIRKILTPRCNQNRRVRIFKLNLSKWIVRSSVLLPCFGLLVLYLPTPDAARHHPTAEQAAWPGHAWFNSQRRRVAPPPFSYPMYVIYLWGGQTTWEHRVGGRRCASPRPRIAWARPPRGQGSPRHRHTSATCHPSGAPTCSTHRYTMLMGGITSPVWRNRLDLNRLQLRGRKS